MEYTSRTKLNAVELPPDLAQVYLMAVEETFQGLRRSLNALSAMVLLLHNGNPSSTYPLDLGLEETASRSRYLTDAARSIDVKFSKLPAHQSLVDSCLLVQLCCEQLRTAIRTKPDARDQAVARVLGTTRKAYGRLKQFSFSTPWDPTSINSSCACGSN